MAFIVDEETGNITLVQGDSGKYPVENVPCDKNYTIYFGIYNDKRKPVGFEISENIIRGGGDTPVFDNDLFAWSHSSSLLFSLTTDVAVGNVLYDSDNEATENTVTAINSIVYNNGTYIRDTSNNINEYETSLYAWGSDNIVYTKDEMPDENDTVYDSDEQDTGYTVSEYQKLYAWEGVIPPQPRITYLYTKKEIPEEGDYIYNSNGELINNAYVHYDGNVYPEYLLPIYINDRTVVFGSSFENNESYIVVNETSCFRAEQDDIREVSSVDAYAWNNDGDIIYTIQENPIVNGLIYNNELTILGRINSIGSILVSTDEYLRSETNDIVAQGSGGEIPTTNIEFSIPASLTNYLKVKNNEETATYYFGIKLCSDEGLEDTLLLGDSQIGDLNTITVYPKKLEGTING